LRRGADDWLFVMGNDNRVITLIEQFEHGLRRGILFVELVESAETVFHLGKIVALNLAETR
jgi:hypothetical protein